MRRYGGLKQSRGSSIPSDVRMAVHRRDRGCVGPRAGLPGDCAYALELDHVRASHGMAMKSEATADNLVLLCGMHHRFKTEHGRDVRPLLLDYIARVSAR